MNDHISFQMSFDSIQIQVAVQKRFLPKKDFSVQKLITGTCSVIKCIKENSIHHGSFAHLLHTKHKVSSLICSHNTCYFCTVKLT